jgi:hypothetical protein
MGSPGRYILFSAWDDELQRCSHLPALGRSYMAQRQAVQNFPDASQVSLHKNNKINLSTL